MEAGIFVISSTLNLLDCWNRALNLPQGLFFMNRPEPSANLNLSRNILLAIGLFNICFYAFVLRTVEVSIPKMLDAQNNAMEPDKKMTEEELVSRKQLVITNAKSNSKLSIAAGIGIVILAFFIPLAPSGLAVFALGLFLITLGYQAYLGFEVFTEGILIKVICVFAFFQSVRFSLEYELRNVPKIKKHQIQFPEPDA
ncbi:MAG: hypothetical protein EBQ87_14370 [Planctomycetes bacterium]|nr:hypothetical protein [Planctomycetota bacterium]